MFGSRGPAGRISVSTSEFFGDRIEFHGNLQLWARFQFKFRNKTDGFRFWESSTVKGQLSARRVDSVSSIIGAPRKEEFKDAGFVLEQDG